MDLVPSEVESAETALEALHEEDEVEDLVADLPLHDELTPYKGERVVSYAGAPGTYGSCPRCGVYGNRVDGWGKFTCDNCGYVNAEERRLARHVPRRIRSLQ